MIPHKILKKVRKIEIHTRGLVNNLFGGEYHSAIKGRGMTFSEVREYQPGDDIRLIDWNVTARSGDPFVKIYEEERELTVFILVDISGSGNFGSVKQLKMEYASEIAAVLGFSAIKNNDKVGLILFSDDIEKFLAPKKGKSHILRLIRDTLFTTPKSARTSIKKALDYLLKVAKRRSVVFLVSDFLDDNYWTSLKVVNRKHDLIGIRLVDPAEIRLPNIGLIKVKDSESGDSFWIDTSNSHDMDQLRQKNVYNQNKLNLRAKKIGFDLITISIEKDFIEPILSFFKMREKRI